MRSLCQNLERNSKTVTNTLRRIFFCSLLAGVMLSAGCLRIGPRSILIGRTNYNLAIQETNSQQLLLNVVRLRYRESPYFLGVASVSQSLEGAVGTGASGSFPQGARDTFGLSLSSSYVEKPSITYTPLQGEDFVRQLLSPIEFEKMALLLNSGWSISRIMRLTVQEMNGLKNAPTASGPTPALAPEFREFRRAVDLLRALEIRGQISIVVVSREEDRHLAIRIAPEAMDSAEAIEFRQLLGLPSNITEYRIGATRAEGQIALVPRPFISSLFYLSQSVEVPAKHRERGLVTVTEHDGAEFDWTELTSELMTIKSTRSRREARRHAIHVSYRGYWYYVPDNDLNAKSTFFLLEKIFALQAGETPSVTPILTLPVAR